MKRNKGDKLRNFLEYDFGKILVTYSSVMYTFSEHVKMEVCYDDLCKTIIEAEMKKVEIKYEGTMKGNIYHMVS